jgi:integrase
LDEARELRTQARKQVKAGIDPAFTRAAEKHAAVIQGANTFERIARDWLSKQTFAPKHGKNVLSRLEKDVFRHIGHLPISDIKPKDIVAIMRGIEGRGAPNVAQRINQYCNNIFNYAIQGAICEVNPAQACSKLIKLPPIQHRSHLAEGELPGFMDKVSKAKPSKMNLAVKLLALTFVRPGELRQAKWEEIDEQKALWSIPAARMKMGRDHVVPLSRQALKVLKELRSLTGRSEYLFHGQKVTKPVSDVALINAVKAMTGDKASPHGFRHTASTILNEQGYNADHIEIQLAHVEENKVRGTYNKAQYLEQRKVMMQDWADFLDDPSAKASNVVPMRRSA